MTEQQEKKPTVTALNHTRMQSGEYARQVHVITVPEGTPKENVLAPGFYAHVAAQIRPYDKLEVRTDDNAWYGELLAVQVGDGGVKVQELFFINIAPLADDSVVIDGFELKFRGPHHRWSVIRKADRHPISDGHASKAVAMKWLSDNRTGLAA